MKTLYLECSMGAAGDMLTASLLELLDDKSSFLEKMNALGLPGVRISASPAESCGITGTHVTVTVNGSEEDEQLHEDDHEHEHDQHEHSHHLHEHTHSHTGLHEIEHILAHLALPQPVRQNALAVFQLIAQAEGHVHGCSMEQIHFHEVGTMDAVADVVAVCWLMHLIAPAAGARPGHSLSAAGHSHLWRQRGGRALHPHRRSAAEIFCAVLR